VLLTASILRIEQLICVMPIVMRKAMISVALNPDIEQRLAELARRRGLSEGDFARELIEACIEDLDDIQMAVGRLESRQPALTAEQARKALRLDD
jgi:predicted DNA-binding protein